jgi:hypothetical protein
VVETLPHIVDGNWSVDRTKSTTGCSVVWRSVCGFVRDSECRSRRKRPESLIERASANSPKLFQFLGDDRGPPLAP